MLQPHLPTGRVPLRKHAPSESLQPTPNRPFFHNFVLTVNLTNNGEPTDTTPQGTSTPIKATPVLERRLSGKKLNASKIKASHLSFDMQDRQERARKSVEAENQAVVSDRTPGKDHGSGRGLSHGLPVMLPNLVEDGPPTVPSGLTLGSSQWGTKQPCDDDEITEISDGGEPVGPPKKKKKKKKSKDTSKDEVPLLEGWDDGSCPSTSTAEPVVNAEEPTPVPEISRVPEEEDKTSKKKKEKYKKGKPASRS